MPTKALKTSYDHELRLFPDIWNKIGLALFVLFALLYPFLVTTRWLTVGNLSFVFTVGSIGLMILTGFCGQISLGHAAFLAIGAYTAAILGEQIHLPFYLAIPAAGVAATAVGLLIGPFALRLEGLYLAIVTIGLLFLTAHILMSFPEYTHGATGIAVPMYIDFSSSSLFSDDTKIGALVLGFKEKLYYLYLLLTAFMTYIAFNIKRSSLGRAMMAVRDQDIAASVIGINLARTKIISFGISSFFAGVAGAMFAYQQQYITIEPPFDFFMSVQYIAMIIVGGVGTLFGAIWGALFFAFIVPFADSFASIFPYLSELSSAQRSTLLTAVIVSCFMIFEPLGLFGIWIRIKIYFMAWPFKY